MRACISEIPARQYQHYVIGHRCPATRSHHHHAAQPINVLQHKVPYSMASSLSYPFLSYKSHLHNRIPSIVNSPAPTKTSSMADRQAEQPRAQRRKNMFETLIAIDKLREKLRQEAEDAQAQGDEILVSSPSLMHARRRALLTSWQE